MSEANGKKLEGGCLCGAVRYEVEGPFRPVVACHCRQCARWTGHFVAATAVAPDRFSLSGDDKLKWYRSSDSAERGFCGTCGSSLFWRPIGHGHISIMAGTLDGDTGLMLGGHIYTGVKSDYYDICDGKPQYDEGDKDAQQVPK